MAARPAPAPRLLAPAPLPPPRVAALPAPPIGRVVRWAFLLYVASLAFEIPRRSIPLEVPTITASLLLLAAGLSPRASFYRVPEPLVWFATYLLAFMAAAAIGDVESPSRTTDLFLLVLQVILVFWVTYNLFAQPALARAALWTFGFACAVSAALPLVGIGQTAIRVHTGGMRLSVFGQNPNHRALILAAGLLVLVGLIQGQAYRRHRLSRARALAWVLIAIIAAGIVQTGSRVGLAATGVGLLVYGFALSRQMRPHRWRHIAVGLVALAGLLWASTRSEVMRNRLRPTQEVATFSGRERLFPALWEMVQERPVLGWGPINNQYELALRIGERKRPSRDAHNLVLELLTATGIVGAVPFLVGLALCVRGAWWARRGRHGRLPLALTAAVLVATLSANLVATKVLWLVLAFGLAAGHAARREAS